MKDKKWWIFIGIMIITIIVLLVVFKPTEEKKNDNTNNSTATNEVTIDEGNNKYVEVQEDGTRLNKSEELLKTKTIDGIEISNIKVSEKDNFTEILADAKNTTDKEVEGFWVDLIFYGDNQIMIAVISVYIPQMDAKGSATLNTNVTGDYANAYTFTINKKDVQE